MMKIFFYDDGQILASIITGYIQLQKLPSNRIPSIPEILAIPEFNLYQFRTVGVPYFLGYDQYNQEIYSIDFGSKKDHDLGLQVLDFLLEKIGSRKNYCFISTSIKKNCLLFIVNICLRLNLIKIRYYLTAYIIQKKYTDLQNIVECTKGLTGIEEEKNNRNY